MLVTVMASDPEKSLPLPRRSPDIIPSKGESCSTSVLFGGSPPNKCPQGTECVLTFYGFAVAELPNKGVCRKVREAPTCSNKFCSRAGPYGVCKSSDGEFGFCSAWATSENREVDTFCFFPCPEKCLRRRLRASDGSTYCNSCMLIKASCKARFSFFGPVFAPDKCFQKNLLQSRRECCLKYRIGCSKPGEACSTGGTPLPPVPCIKSTKCVVTDFGLPAIDLPTSGHCRWVYRESRCSLNFCERHGASSICKLGPGFTTCGAWASRPFATPKMS